MLPDTITNELDVQDESIPVNTSTGLHLATTELTIYGSVHASGEAYLTVNEVYGSLENDRAFSLQGSVHDAGHSELTIGSEHSIEFPPNASLPSAKGFSKVMSDRYEDKTGGSIHIDTLVLFDKDTPALAKVFDTAGYDCYDEVELYGNVHDTGTIDVTIDKVFIIQP